MNAYEFGNLVAIQERAATKTAAAQKSSAAYAFGSLVATDPELVKQAIEWGNWSDFTKGFSGGLEEGRAARKAVIEPVVKPVSDWFSAPKPPAPPKPAGSSTPNPVGPSRPAVLPATPPHNSPAVTRPSARTYRPQLSSAPAPSNADDDDEIFLDDEDRRDSRRADQLVQRAEEAARRIGIDPARQSINAQGRGGVISNVNGKQIPLTAEEQEDHDAAEQMYNRMNSIGGSRGGLGRAGM